jgi:pimeloyl-ACP methyl ester carboxylesterase
MKIIGFILLLLVAESKAQTDTLYPFPVHYFNCTEQGQRLRMAYMDVQPDKANGKTVILLHGKNFNGAYWEQTAQVLSAEGYRVIMPDQIGFGKSSFPSPLQYSFQMLARHTKGLLDSLGVNEIYLLGHSMGGMLATRFTLMYPGMVKRLILANPIGLEDWKTKVPYQTVDEWYRQELTQSYEKLKHYQLVNYYHNEWKAAYDRWLNLYAAQLKRPDYPQVARNSALIYDMIYTQPVCYEFENINCPTLLIIGQSDRTALNKEKADKDVQPTLGNYPVLGRKTAKKIKHSQLVELKGTGHLPHIENFDGFIQPLKKFLEN